MTKPVQIINNYWLKETLLNGNPILDKFYKEDLIRMINILKDENQKYKEVINKIKYICDKVPYSWSVCGIDVVHKIEKILKEVEHE